MAKPRVQTRVDPHVKRELDDYAEKNEMSNSEAVRYLLQSQLREEQRAATDGGEILSRLDEIRAAQIRRERASAFQTGSIVAGLVFIGAAVVGALGDVGVYVGGALVLALQGVSLLARRRAAAVELPRDERADR